MFNDMLPDEHPLFKNRQDIYEMVTQPPYLYPISDNPPKPENFYYHFHYLDWLESLPLKPNNLFLYMDGSKDSKSNTGSGWSIRSPTLQDQSETVIQNNHVYIIIEGYYAMGTTTTGFDAETHAVLEALLWKLIQKQITSTSVTICTDNTATL